MRALSLALLAITWFHGPQGRDALQEREQARRDLAILSPDIADWFQFNRQQRIDQAAARDVKITVSRSIYSGSFQKLFASLTPEQVGLLRDYSLRLDGLRCLLDPGLQNRVGLRRDQALKLESVLKPLPPHPVRLLGGAAHNPYNPLPERLRALDQDLKSLIHTAEVRHTAEVNQYREVLKALSEPQAARLRRFLSLSKMSPVALDHTMYKLIAIPSVQRAIGMSREEVDRYHESFRHPQREPGSGRILDLWGPTRQAVSRLGPQRQLRLRQLALQSKPSLITSREVSRQLGLSYEQQVRLDFENEIADFRYWLHLERDSILREAPLSSPPRALQAPKPEDTAEVAAVTHEIAVSDASYRSQQVGIIRAALSRSQSTLWKGLLGSPFPGRLPP